MTAIRQRCACRAVIETEPDDKSVEHAVRVHIEQPEHQAYRALEQLRSELLTAPTVRVMPMATLRRIA